MTKHFQTTNAKDVKTSPCRSSSELPPRSWESRVVHHVRVVPTLALPTEQSLPDSGVALLRLVLHPGLQDARVRKID